MNNYYYLKHKQEDNNNNNDTWKIFNLLSTIGYNNLTSIFNDSYKKR